MFLHYNSTCQLGSLDIQLHILLSKLTDLLALLLVNQALALKEGTQLVNVFYKARFILTFECVFERSNQKL